MHLNDVKDQNYTCNGVTAPVSLWIAAGMEFINRGDTWELAPARELMGGLTLTDGAIIEARVATGDTGEKALVWLIAERRRQAEERARNRAMQAAAEAQKKAGDDAIHAARIHRQAEELHCLASGVSKQAINSRLE